MLVRFAALPDPARRHDVRDELLRDLVRDAGVACATLTVVRRCAACGGVNHGKLEVVEALEAGLHVSVSYAAGLVYVAVGSQGPVGVDVESVEALGRAPVADVLLSPSERASAVPWSSRALAHAWVRKEALLKATGYGLAVAPSSFGVPLPGAAPTGRTAPGGPLHDVVAHAVWHELADLPDPDLVGCAVELPRSGPRRSRSLR